jgi:hypothetical protein
MQTRTLIACFSVAGLILQGCATAPPPPVSHAVVYATDMAGKAPVCQVKPVTVKDGATIQAAMTTGGGGWCGLPVSHDGKPFTYGLLTTPAHAGKVFVHTVGDDTRIDYIPQQTPAPPDSFAVRVVPGDATIQISVNATPAVSK